MIVQEWRTYHRSSQLPCISREAILGWSGARWLTVRSITVVFKLGMTFIKGKGGQL
jgi:hypothetical protein